VALSPDLQTLAVVGLDRMARLLDLRNPAAAPISLDGHENTIIAAAFSPDGQHLATGSTDRSVRIWLVRTETLSEMVCDMVWRDLQSAEWQQFVGPALPYEQTCRDFTPDRAATPEPASRDATPLVAVPSEGGSEV
jgi:hypothetical protein